MVLTKDNSKNKLLVKIKNFHASATHYAIQSDEQKVQF